MSRQLTSGVLGRKSDYSYLLNNLIAGFDFNGNITDRSSNQIQLTHLGDNDYTFVEGVNGKQAINLIGTDSFAFNNPGLETSDPCSFSGWMYSTIDKRQGLFYTGTPQGQVLGVREGRRIHAYIAPATTVQSDINSYELNVWNHIVSVYENEIVKLFLNGILVAEGQGYPEIDTLFRVCASSSLPRRWEGKLQECYIFDKALNINEVRALAKGI